MNMQYKTQPQKQVENQLGEMDGQRQITHTDPTLSFQRPQIKPLAITENGSRGIKSEVF